MLKCALCGYFLSRVDGKLLLAIISRTHPRWVLLYDANGQLNLKRWLYELKVNPRTHRLVVVVLADTTTLEPLLL